MIRKNLSFASMLSALLLIGLQAASHATLLYGRSNSTISEGDQSAVTVSATVYKNLPSPTAPPQLSGSIMIAGHTGNLNLTLSAQAKDISVSSETVNGVLYTHAVITTLSFSYLDLTAQLRTPAWMRLELTKGSDGSQSLGFEIYRVSDNTLIAETEMPGAPGVYCDLPLASGANLISRPLLSTNATH